MQPVTKVPVKEISNHPQGRGEAGPTIKTGRQEKNPTKGGGINRATQG